MQLTPKAGLALALLTAGNLASVRPAAAQHVYDASADFSITTNPSPLDGGVWSYGAETTLGSAFSLDATPRGNVGDPEQGWAGTINTVYGTFPLLVKNISGKTDIVTSGGNTQTVLPNQLELHPGPNGEYSVLRFTAPTTSTFSFSSDFNAINSAPTTTDVHVLLDNLSIADGGINVNGGGNTTSLSSNSLALTKGDTLDFVVGFGNGNYFADATGLFAKVTDLKASPVPEASTTVSFCLLLCLGLGGRVWSARRRKGQTGE